jgi:hypothetical protein
MHRSQKFSSDCELQSLLSGHLYPLLTVGTEYGAKVTLAGPQSVSLALWQGGKSSYLAGIELKLPRIKLHGTEFEDFQIASLINRFKYEKRNGLPAVKCNLKYDFIF